MCADASGSVIVPDAFITTLDPAAALGGRNNLSRSLDLSKVPCLVPAAVDCDHTTVPISSTATTALKQTLLFILPPSGGFLDPQTRGLMRHSAEIGWTTPLRRTTPGYRIVQPDPNSFPGKWLPASHGIFLRYRKPKGKDDAGEQKTVLPLRYAVRAV